MNTSAWLAFITLLVPFLLGIWAGWALHKRVLSLGWPWAVLPLGGLLKRIWEKL